MILFIDDDPFQIDYYVEELRSRGLRVVVAGSVAEGRRCLRSERPSLVILDVQLPLCAPGDLLPTEREHAMVSGLTLLREIRQQDRELPVILFTVLLDVDAAMGLDSNTRMLRKVDVLPHELADLVQAALLG